eukprot:1408769-Rhodomonas_salina.1
MSVPEKPVPDSAGSCVGVRRTVAQSYASTAHYIVVQRPLASYSHAYWRTTAYYSVLQRTTAYYSILQRITASAAYYSVLRRRTVVRRTRGKRTP